MSTLEEIKARVEGHTPGPWGVYDANEGTMANPMWCVANDAFHNPPADGDEPWIAVEVYVGGKEDAELIAAAPKLIAALEAVEERLTWLDAIQEGDNNTPKNANAGGVASFIRAGITEALV